MLDSRRLLESAGDAPIWKDPVVTFVFRISLHRLPCPLVLVRGMIENKIDH